MRFLRSLMVLGFRMQGLGVCSVQGLQLILSPTHRMLQNTMQTKT